MESMQERIDALIQMRKEKPEHKWEWEKLSNALLHETNLLTPEQTIYLNKAFKEITQSELLKVWDDRFHEVLITGTFTGEYVSNGAYSIPVTADSIASTTAKMMLTDEMVKAYTQYKKEKKNDK